MCYLKFDANSDQRFFERNEYFEKILLDSKQKNPDLNLVTNNHDNFKFDSQPKTLEFNLANNYDDILKIKCNVKNNENEREDMKNDLKEVIKIENICKTEVMVTLESKRNEKFEMPIEQKSDYIVRRSEKEKTKFWNDSHVNLYTGKRYDVNFQPDIPGRRIKSNELYEYKEIHWKSRKNKSSIHDKFKTESKIKIVKHYNRACGNLCVGHLTKEEVCECKQVFIQHLNKMIEFEKIHQNYENEKKKIKKNMKTNFFKWIENIAECSGRFISNCRQTIRKAFGKESASKKNKQIPKNADKLCESISNENTSIVTTQNNIENESIEVNVENGTENETIDDSSISVDIDVNDEVNNQELDDFDPNLVGDILYDQLGTELNVVGEIGDIEQMFDAHVTSFSALFLAQRKFKHIACINPSLFTGIDYNKKDALANFDINNLFNQELKLIFNYSYQHTKILFFPIVWSNHWTLFVYDSVSNVLRFHDPKNNWQTNIHEKFIRMIINDLFNVTNVPYLREDIPLTVRQKSADGINCGIYVCFYIEMIAKFGHIEEIPIDLKEARNRSDFLTRQLMQRVKCRPISMNTTSVSTINQTVTTQENSNQQQRCFEVIIDDNVNYELRDCSEISCLSPSQTNMEASNLLIADNVSEISSSICEQEIENENVIESYKNFCQKQKIQANSKKSRLLYKNYCDGKNVPTINTSMQISEPAYNFQSILSFDEFCRQKKIGKNNPKSRKAYQIYFKTQNSLQTNTVNTNSATEVQSTRKRTIQNVTEEIINVEANENSVNENALRLEIIREINPRTTKRRRQEENTIIQSQIRMENEIRRQNNNPVVLHPAANSNNVSPFSTGEMDKICEACLAKHFRCETSKMIINHDGERIQTFNDCCNFGNIVLDLSDDYTDFLKALLLGHSSNSKTFHDTILKLNRFCSFAHFKGMLAPLPGIFNYRFHGEIEHYIPRNLHHQQYNKPLYGQLYVFETEELMELTRTLPYFKENELQLAVDVHEHIKNENLFAASYLTMSELEKQEIEAAKKSNIEPKTIKMVLSGVTQNPSHNYAPPAAQEVVGIYVIDDDGLIPSNDIEVYSINSEKSEIVRRHTPNVEKLMFPVFYPSGRGDTWHDQKRQIENSQMTKNLSIRNYGRYKKAVRDLPTGQFNPIPFGGKLKCEWIIVCSAITERERIEYFRHNQRTIQAEVYTGVTEYLSKYSERNDVPIGKKVILPSSFTGGPRWKAEKFHDSMELVRKFGAPELFITVTCNPNHPDIVAALGGRKPEDYPEIVNKHFYLLMDNLIHTMKNEKIFGEIEYAIVVYEWQKRGLTHAHTLWKLKNSNWKGNPEILDKYIKAYFCNKQEDPELFDLIAKHMVHRPCGTANANAMCMVNQKCKRHFPKDFCDETNLIDNSYPKYKRPNNGTKVQIKVGNKRYDVDNRSVVPFSPYLLKKYKCHINVEFVASLKTVTYLFKYFFKGPDSVKIAVTRGTANYDETVDFTSARYFSTHEADWRLSFNKIFWSTHSPERLALHLPLRQMITFNPDASIEEITNALEKETKLMAWFKYNQEHSDPNDPNNINLNLTYAEFAYQHVWKNDHWEKRSNCSKLKICRLPIVDPRNSELFHCRKLLQVIKGAKDYEDLRRDPEKDLIHPTNVAACIARGLTHDDTMFIDAMEEAKYHRLPRQMRFLYATIIINCTIKDPVVMWELFREALTSDYRRNNDSDQAEILAFRQVLKMILKSDCQISDYPVLEYLASLPEFIINNDPEFIIENRDRGIEMQSTLNADQKVIFDVIMKKVINPTPNEPSCYMIQAPGGCGKTYTLNCLLSTLIGMGKNVKIMAWSGIAASLYQNGQTCHKAFKLDFPFQSDSNSGVSATNETGKQLIQANVIIIDEVSMLPKHAFELFDDKLRELMQNNVPFGGKIVILSGDFRQLPPVVENGKEQDIINTSVRKSKLWQHFKTNIFELTINERANNIDNFANEVLAIGEGKTNDRNGTVNLPDVCIFNGNLVQEIFGDLLTSNDPSNFATRAILATLNEQVDKYNDEALNLLDTTTERIYKSLDEVETTHVSVEFVPEAFERDRPRGFPQHKLRLRKSAVITLLRNLSIEDGLCNGTRLIILELGKHIIKCRKINNLSANDDDNIVLLPKITLKSDEGIFILYRFQFPIRLAFSCTINKSQGTTYEIIGIDVSQKIFTHGHLYVALSRTRSWDRIKIVLPADESNRTKNIVYQDLLNDDLLSIVESESVAVISYENDNNEEPIEVDNDDEPMEVDDGNEPINNENNEETVEENTDDNLGYESP